MFLRFPSCRNHRFPHGARNAICPVTPSHSLSLLPALTIAGALSIVQPPRYTGFHFEHKDWEVACDNTGTCRAAGYQHEEEYTFIVAVLLTRKAGPGTKVTGKLCAVEHQPDGNPTAPRAVRMTVEGRYVATITGALDECVTLPSTALQALLASAPDTSRIEFVKSSKRWQLSGNGMRAVLLKMDEYQGRLMTPGALVSRGSRAESQVHPALPRPVVRVPHRAVGMARVARSRWPDLARALQGTLPQGDECEALSPPKSETLELRFAVLGPTHLLVSAICRGGAYQGTFGYWVVNRRGAWAPRLVTLLGSADDVEVVYSSLKGRGFGDCWEVAEWAWNGREFVQTEEATTGMCRGFAGGAGLFPTWVTDVRNPNAKR